MAILAVPPVVPDIHRQLHLDVAALGMLTTLPVLMLALAAVAGSAMVARLGPRRALVIGLVVVGICSGLRGAGGVVVIFAASVALGAGVSVMQPAMPVVAQSWFGDRAGFATNVYGNGILVGEALAASLTLPLVVPAVGSWRGALALWGLPALAAAALVAMPIGKLPQRASVEPLEWWPRWNDGVTWRTGLLQGGASVLFLGTNAFLASYFHAVGRPGLVTACLAALNTSQLGASVMVGVLARRAGRPQPLLCVCAVAAFAGLGLMILAPGWPAIVGAGLVGLCSAVAFVVALALPPLLASPGDVHRLAAGMFFIGYLSAFVFPLAGGIAWDLTGHPAASFVPAAIGAAMFGSALLWPGKKLRQRLDVRIR
jgi:MFS transporter, CP family, cyanate transporter